ncbi:MAG: hypothetical protein LBL26_03395 [Peptococcaceae bacterium]|nr:hypothetical protein [Peptococcaceae bacterium]
MKKVTRDTTKDLFLATLNLVKENGHYGRAEAIMDYVLPDEPEDVVRNDIELTNYCFDFYASAQFGGSEGIYIDCYIVGEYSETEIKFLNYSTGTVEKETRRHVGTLKTLNDDLESMKIMGELCGALIYYAHQYVNKNIERYTPTRELEQEERRRIVTLARNHYIHQLSANISSGKITVAFEAGADHADGNQQSEYPEGIETFLKKEISKFAAYGRYSEASSGYCEWLDGKFNPGNDSFGEYVPILMSTFPDLSICQAAGNVYTWLCTRKQDFIVDSAHEETT